MTGGVHVPQRPSVRLKSSRGCAAARLAAALRQAQADVRRRRRAGHRRRTPAGAHPPAPRSPPGAAADRPRLRRPPRAAAARALPRAAAPRAPRRSRPLLLDQIVRRRRRQLDRRRGPLPGAHRPEPSRPHAHVARSPRACARRLRAVLATAVRAARRQRPLPHAPGSSTTAGTTTRSPAPPPARGSAGKPSAAAPPPGLRPFRLASDEALPACGARRPARGARRRLAVRRSGGVGPPRGVDNWSYGGSPSDLRSDGDDGPAARRGAGPASSATHAGTRLRSGRGRTLDGTRPATARTWRGAASHIAMAEMTLATIATQKAARSCRWRRG